MPKQFSLSCLVDLPADPFEAAELVGKLKVPWYAMLKNLQDAKVEFRHKQEELETRAKPEGVRRRGPNKPKPVPVAEAAE